MGFGEVRGMYRSCQVAAQCTSIRGQRAKDTARVTTLAILLLVGHRISLFYVSYEYDMASYLSFPPPSLFLLLLRKLCALP